MASTNPQTGQPYDLVMTHPPGSPGFNAAEYNPRFIFWCYKKLLGRDPFATGDTDGFNYQLNFLNSTGNCDYSNRPELFKDGKLVPYLEHAVARIKSKKENPHLVEENAFFLDPQVGTWPDGLDLTKWYGKLSPGSYRLIIRHRFEIDGPWSDESAPLLFEVPATGRN